ncbi:glycosyltransferase family 8 protein [Pedobacter sp. AW31-3R]|uniref:glycosyltransferase family 8 protein n=1 Tax=Pedobacter sp. AW31-3R TaxID=3445781 RepID=UPI003F9F9056
MINKTDKKTPLVIAFTPNYIVPAAVCISSVLEYASPADCFHIICLLAEPLSNAMQEQLCLLGGDRVCYSFLNLEGELGDIYVDEKYSIAASYRLLLPDLLPQYDKVIYVDCDVVVRNDLAKLFREADLGNHYLAGVYEATLDFQVAHMEAIGCAPGTYLNSGFLLMNLQQLRADHMVQLFITASKKEYLEFPDQDVLNQLCKGRIIGLPPFYNSIRTFYLPQYKPDFLKYYREGDWQAVQKQGTVHYTGSKPWNTFTVKFDLWWSYYEQLPDGIKAYGGVDHKMSLLYKVYRTWLGGFLIHTLQYVYRQLKNRRES